MAEKDKTIESSAVLRDHRRQWRRCQYVYPVISRRAKGVSIGVNLNIDQRCNFHCVYCQIDRSQRRPRMEIDPEQLGAELDEALLAVTNGRLWDEPRFAETPAPLRRLNDIAFSGDGEPTTVANFDPCVQSASDALQRAGLLGNVKIVVITNATALQTPQVLRALPILDEAAGEIWAKLDSGTPEFFRRVNRPSKEITQEGIDRGILSVSRDRAVVIQTLFFRWNGSPPSSQEQAAYLTRLKKLRDRGARLKLIQLHTVARRPAEDSVSSLPKEELEALGQKVRQALPQVPVEVFAGSG